MTLGRRSHHVLIRSRAGEPGLPILWTLRQMHILKPDVLETAPMGHDPIRLLGSMGLTGGLRLDLQYVTIARHNLVEHRAYDSAKE
jgi:hypothetical protein